MQPPLTIWNLRQAPSPLPEFPEYGHQLPRLVRHLMAVRGLPGKVPVREFLQPKLADLSDPFELPNMRAAVDRLLAAIDNKEEICIYGDYDVDGVSSVTLLQRTLQAYGANSRYFVPQRSAEGYGLSDAGIKRLLNEGVRPDLIVTVDCGTASLEEIRNLKEQGIAVIIIDHHQPHPDGLPDCEAVVNPQLGDDFGYLCAAGVVFKLAHAMLKTRRLADFDLKEFIDIAAVATIADIVPLQGENRLLVRHGLRQLTKTRNPGLKAVAEIAGLDLGRIPTGQDIGFRIGPRINAAGRMDQPEDALALLLTECSDNAKAIAQELDLHNSQRQKHELEIRTQALEMVAENANFENEPVIVLGSRDWHPGVVGIVASRLMRQFHKPAFIISIDDNGIGKGSGRGIPGLSLVDAIHHCSDHLIAGGGHAMAAGLSVNEEQIDSFRAAFADYVNATLAPEHRHPTLNIDAKVDFAELELSLLDSYELLQPFGNSNPQPMLMSSNVHLKEKPRELKNKHLKLSMHQNGITRDAIFFSGAEHPLPPTPWDIAFTIDRNTFRGRTTLQIIITAIRAAE